MVDMPIDEVLAHLPHRYPFLLVDRVLPVHSREVARRIEERDESTNPSSRATFRAGR